MSNLPVYILGRSLGGAVGIYAASITKYQQRIKGLIVENTFTCIRDVVYSIIGKLVFLRPLIWLLLRNHWNSLARIKDI